MKIIHTDILVLGLGSAGSAAVYRALQGGASVVGAEQMAGPGGTSACGGVNNWEPGVSFPGMHTEIARRLMERGDAFVGRPRNTSLPPTVSPPPTVPGIRTKPP